MVVAVAAIMLVAAVAADITLAEVAVAMPPESAVAAADPLAGSVEAAAADRQTFARSIAGRLSTARLCARNACTL